MKKLTFVIVTAAGVATLVALHHRTDLVEAETVPSPQVSGSVTKTPARERGAAVSVPQLRKASDSPADPDAAMAYKKHKLAMVSDVFDRWVQRYGVSPEQEIKVLEVLADAQRVYDETSDLRDQLGQEAQATRDARMTPEQRQAKDAAAKRYSQTLRGPNDQEREAASLVVSEVWDKVDEELKATAPPEEQAAFETSHQVERDLDAQVEAALSEVLSPTQLEGFASPSFYLQAGNNVHRNDEYAKTLADRRRRR